MILSLQIFVLILLFCHVDAEQGYYNILYKNGKYNFLTSTDDSYLLNDGFKNIISRQNIMENINIFSATLRKTVDSLSEVNDDVNDEGSNAPSVLQNSTILSALAGLGGLSPFSTNISLQTALAGLKTFSNIIPILLKVSPSCWNDMITLFQGITSGKQWALQMLDSLGLPSSIVMSRLSTTWLGKFEECQDVRAPRFNGQYCLEKITAKNLTNPLTHTMGLEVNVGMCVPSSCSNEDITKLLNATISRLSNDTIFAKEFFCQMPDVPYDTRAQVALTIIGIIALLMIIGTAYDIRQNVLIFNKPVDKGKNSPDTKSTEKVQETQENGNLDNHVKTEDSVIGGRNGDVKNGTLKSLENGEITKVTLNNSADKCDNTTPGTLGKLLLSFSVYTNGAKILSTKQGGGTLTAVNGIRLISMTWVILGHTFGFGLRVASNLGEVAPAWIKRRTFMAIANAEVSVDTFFALSGTLLTYIVLKQLKKGKGRLNWAMFYFHRYWRLTPALMLILMIQVTLMKYLGSGPMWYQDGFEHDYCKGTWYWNLFYVNNFLKAGKECFAHSWYLANDMQFYVTSPPILWALYKSKIAGTITVGLVWIAHVAVTSWVSVHFELGSSNLGRSQKFYFDNYYQMPYCRIGPYLIGMYTGYILFKTNCKVNINKYLNLFVWFIMAVSACTVLYGVYDDLNGDYMTVTVAAVYNAVHKSVWGLVVCWVIFACATGNGGFVNTLLSWKALVPLSRLTYCAYLVHPMIMYYFYYSRKRLQYWDDHQAIYDYFGHLVASYAVAFVASLGFESPMMALEKVVFKR